MTPDDVLAAVRAMAPTVADRAAEAEAARRLPADLLDGLRDAGCFRMSMPESHGGLGADLAAISAVLEALARADAATAWTVMIGGNAWIDLAGLPRTTFDKAFDRPDVIVAGVFAPSGSIVPADDGHLLKVMADHKLDAIVHKAVEHQPTLIKDGVNPPFTDQKGAPHINTFLMFVPSIVVPAGMTRSDRPAGITFLGRPYDDARMIALAYAYEQATRHRRPPPALP